MRFVFRSIAAVVLLLVPTTAIAGDSLKDTIQSREDEWSAAFNAGDTAALTAFYVEDAVLLVPGGAPVHGNAAIGEALSGLFGVLLNLKLNTDEVRPMGSDYAVEIGHVAYDQADGDGTMYSVISNYVVSWHKGEDGVWRYVTDIFNERQRTPKSE